MQRRKGLIYPRIVEEVVDPAELQQVWNCGYLTVNRIMYGRKAPNHKQKEQLSEYLGIPVEELWITTPEFQGFPTASRLAMTEEEKQAHTKKYQHDYYMNNTKLKRAEQRLAKSLDAPSTDNSEII